jgi:hypothetical protein
MTETWTYRDPSWSTGGDIVGYDVEATDGSIGKIDSKSDEASSSYIVVDTGFWIFGKKRLIPAGAVTAVDHDDEKVFVAMTKDAIKDAPDYEESSFDDTARSSHESYYGTYTAS